MQSTTVQQITDEELEFMIDCEDIGYEYARFLLEDSIDDEDWLVEALEGGGAYVDDYTMESLQNYGLLEGFVAKYGKEPDRDHVCEGLLMGLEELYLDIKETLELYRKWAI